MWPVKAELIAVLEETAEHAAEMRIGLPPPFWLLFDGAFESGFQIFGRRIKDPQNNAYLNMIIAEGERQDHYLVGAWRSRKVGDEEFMLGFLYGPNDVRAVYQEVASLAAPKRFSQLRAQVWMVCMSALVLKTIVLAALMLLGAIKTQGLVAGVVSVLLPVLIVFVFWSFVVAVIADYITTFILWPTDQVAQLIKKLRTFTG